MPSHADFQLPGLLNNDNGKRIMITAIAAAYSSWANPRRLEDPLYVFWGLVMQHLVLDFGGQVLVAPQSKIYKDPPGHPRPDISTATTAGIEKGSVVPDFSLLGVILAHRSTKNLLQYADFPSSITNWPSVQVVMTEIYALFEIKTMPSRHHVSQERFEIDLEAKMTSAMNQATKQAIVAFEEPSYNLESIILIAAAGEWWRFRFVQRSEFEVDVENFLDDFDDFDEGSAKDDDDSKLVDPLSPSESSKPVEPVLKGGRHKTRRFTELKLITMASFKPNVEDAVPEEGKWSGYILFGTRQSNQCWYLIHEKLREKKEALYAAAAGIPLDDDGDRSDTETEGDGN